MKREWIRRLARAWVRAISLVWTSAPRLACAQAVLTAVQALLPLLTLYTLKRGVNSGAVLLRETGTVIAEQAGECAARSAETRELIFWLLLGAVSIGLGACLRACAAWVAELHAIDVSDRVHALLHTKLLRADLAFFEDSREQDALHLVQSQALSRPVAVMDALFRMAHSVVALSGILLLLAALHPLVAIVPLIASVPIIGIRMARGNRFFEWRREQAPLEREAGYVHHLLTDGAYAKEIRVMGHGTFCRNRFTAVRSRLRAARLRLLRLVLTQELAMQFLALATMGVLLLWMAGRLAAGALSLGALVMYAQAVQRGQAQTGALAGTLAELYQSALFLESFDTLLAKPDTVRTPSRPRALPAPGCHGLVFERVSFTYPGTSRPVLREISFTLHPGERIALVGANASGKSTLLKLMCRFYDPTAGRILFEGVDLREVDPVVWRQRIGALFQDFGQYQFSLAENVWIGDPHGSASDARIAETVRRVGLDALARTDPRGLDTPLGRWLREGIEPSLGQWQRVAVARATLRDADLLLLDEPASALDDRAQDEVIQWLQTVTVGRMAVLASHRRRVIEVADRVLVLREGVLVEEGTIPALRARKGEWASLYERVLS
jgi:ATP-binding cassette subfamily B protein